MGSKMEIKWDKKALLQAIADDPQINVTIQDETIKRRNAANSMAAGYSTGKWHDHATGESKGPTEAKYASSVKKMGQFKMPIGLVYTRNYAAYKENLEHNTLAKVL